MTSSPFNTLQTLELSQGQAQFYSLPALEAAGVAPISKLPVSIRIVLESVLRNCDGLKITENDVKTLANWQPNSERTAEIPFVVARIVLQDFTGVPLLVDLAAMRAAAARLNKDPKIIEPLVPVDLVVDHSVQVDFSSVPNALQLNMQMEFKRNRSRYQFLKWGMQAFDSFNVVPPGIGIVHQVNLEYLAKGVLEKDGVYYPDTLVGTDSHTTMINGLGIVGWGVGGIEAEAGMLGQPVYFLTPDVVGVNLTGRLREGVTATDLVLRVTEMLRAAKVVGKFVEFFGEGAANLSLPDRATIGNMAPEYGATMGFFPVDEETCNYMRATGRSDEHVDTFRKYFQAQGLFGMPQKGDIEYSQMLELDLDSIVPAVAGPKRPQDRINLDALKSTFEELLQAQPANNGYAKSAEEVTQRFQVRTGINWHGSEAQMGGQSEVKGTNGNGTRGHLAPEANHDDVDEHASGEGASHEGSGHSQGTIRSVASSSVVQTTVPIQGGGMQATESTPISQDLSGLVDEKDTAAVTEVEMMNNRPTPDRLEEVPADEFPRVETDLGHGDVVIAAITSCTNTSNPSVMLAAGLVAKKAVERGLSVRPTVKASLAPGSRVVTAYLDKTGLQPYLDQLGFQTVGYGCTTCIGNSGPLDPHIESVVTENDLVVASVLSGNRNFEARVHQNVKANFLMSPPLVVAFALAGTIERDITTEPIGTGKDGQDVYLKDIWPTREEILELLATAMDESTFKRLYRDFEAINPMWGEVPAPTGNLYEWDVESTYIQEPPFFTNFGMEAGTITDIHGARPLAILGDSVTTDHISPAGAIKPNSPAGFYLQNKGVHIEDFNSYGARRGNDRVMTRGTFANVRIKNLMTPGVEGSVTMTYPDKMQMTIFDASTKYQAADVPLVVFAGQEYGTGSSRDWAAKGTRLLGVKAVVAQSYERIHRSNLVGMGVLPLQFKDGASAQSLNLDGSERFDIVGLDNIVPLQDVTLRVHRADNSKEEVAVQLRIDTPIEVEYYRHGGILPFVLRQLVQGADASNA
ncbi:MAG: aconitate hydratase [Abditibacteriota bacterium]|nr:aconitate hydratase [Abditibacteriota bacterium]